MRGTTPISVAAVVVTHNRLENLKKSLECIFPQRVSAIIVVDNCSSDGTAEWLETLEDKRLVICSLMQNTGGAGGFYHGIKYAVENTNNDWVCCFDDDAYAASSLIDRFIKKHGTSGAAFIASAVYAAADARILEMNRPVRRLPRGPRDFIDSIIRRERYVVGDQEYLQDRTVEIAAASMVGLFINAAKAKESVGYPRPELFLYCDDLIYTSAAKLAGESLLFDAELRFSHDCTDDASRIYKQPWKAYLLARNYVIFYKQTAGRRYRLMAFVRATYIFSKLNICDDKWRFLAYTYRGMSDGFSSDLSINIIDLMGSKKLY